MYQRGDHLSVEQAMAWAIELARAGTGYVAPNPLVGCVILDQNSRVLGWGHHARVGSDHAEVAALKAITNPRELEGAHLVVTLEPCAHTGRTPPCAERLAELPLAKVTYGLEDPNPKVCGQGIQKLRDHGIEVQTLVSSRGELEDLAEIFLHNQRHKRAFVTVKVATTLDGQMALRSGASQWISGEAAREGAHALRGAHDAVMVGVGTFLNDDPRLNNRHPNFKDRQHKVMVVDPKGRGLSRLETSRLYSLHAASDIIWLVEQPVSSALGIQIWPLPTLANGSLSLASLTEEALQQGITSILVEGGAGLIGSLLSQKVVQRWSQFIAPDLLGGAAGLQVGAGWGKTTLAERIQLVRPRWRELGRDILFSGRLPE